MKRRVLFAGAYGIGNAGDDAPLQVLTHALRQAHPTVRFDFAFLGRQPDALLAEAAGARFVQNPEYPSRAAAQGKWFRGLNPGDERADLAAIEAEIREADLVVAGAGNVLVDLTLDLFRGPIPLLGLYSFLADLHRVPLFLYGISAGPLATERGRTLSAWIARRAAGVTVRDRASRELLLALDPECGAESLPDPVLGLAPAADGVFAAARAREGIPPPGARPRLVVAPRDLSFLGFDRGALVAALRRLARDWELLFVPQAIGTDCDDRVEIEALIAALPGVSCLRVRERHAPDVLMRFYEGARAALAVRLHGAVFAARAGVPVVGLAYLPKVKGFLETVWLADLCLELAEARPEALVAAVERTREYDGAELASRCRALGRGVTGYVERVERLLGLERREVMAGAAG